LFGENVLFMRNAHQQRMVEIIDRFSELAHKTAAKLRMLISVKFVVRGRELPYLLPLFRGRQIAKLLPVWVVLVKLIWMTL
jgi:hypothetical protein